MLHNTRNAITAMKSPFDHRSIDDEIIESVPISIIQDKLDRDSVFAREDRNNLYKYNSVTLDPILVFIPDS